MCDSVAQRAPAEEPEEEEEEMSGLKLRGESRYPDLPVSDGLIFVANGFVSFLWRIPDSPFRLASHAPPTS